MFPIQRLPKAPWYDRKAPVAGKRGIGLGSSRLCGSRPRSRATDPGREKPRAWKGRQPQWLTSSNAFQNPAQAAGGALRSLCSHGCGRAGSLIRSKKLKLFMTHLEGAVFAVSGLVLCLFSERVCIGARGLQQLSAPRRTRSGVQAARQEVTHGDPPVKMPKAAATVSKGPLSCSSSPWSRCSARARSMSKATAQYLGKQRERKG